MSTARGRNEGTSGAFVKVYDEAAAPTVGTDVPTATLFVPAGSVVSSRHRNGIAFANGIGVGATVGAGDSDTQAPEAGTVVVSLFYR